MTTDASPPGQRTFSARIRSCTGSPVQRIVLEMPAAFRFRAGQYVQVMHPGGPIPLSVASAPRRLPELHLHYRSTPGLLEAIRLDELLAANDRLDLSGPAGDVVFATPLPGALLIVAGGTGIAQALSLIDDFCGTGPAAPVTLLWCIDRPEDAYLAKELEAVEAPWLRLVIVADADRSPANRGMAWLREHGAGFRGRPVVLAGGPGFVYAAYDALVEAGVTPDQMHSDVFAYAPRAP